MDHDLLEPDLIHMCVSGSHAYGMATATSDVDVRGIVFPPRQAVFGLNHFEQAEGKRGLQFMLDALTKKGFAIPNGNEVDYTLMSLPKYFALALNANPNILEQLWMPDRVVLHRSPAMERIISKRHLFLSTKVKFSYSGYAVAQLKRIRLHARWLRHPILKQPEWGDFGLPEKRLIPKDQLDAAKALIRRLIDDWTLDTLETLDDPSREAVHQRMEEALRGAYKAGFASALDMAAPVKDEKDILFDAAVQTLGFSGNFIEYLNKERTYRNALADWNAYQTWLRERNPARAELERKWGYDSKHAGHLFRLMKQGGELLTTGVLHVDRTGIDAEELLAIRNKGIYTYEQVVEWAEKMDARLDEIYKAGSSPLPKKPDHNGAENLLMKLMDQHLYSPEHG